MVNPGRRKCVVGDEGELVECAADTGNDAEEAANTHQLVRERGSVGVGVGVSVSRSLEATLAYIRALVVGAPAGGFVLMAWQAPLCPGLPRTSIRDRSAPSDPQPSLEQGLCAPPVRGHLSERAQLWEGNGAPG
jgi:hypothetical protein